MRCKSVCWIRGNPGYGPYQRVAFFGNTSRRCWCHRAAVDAFICLGLCLALRSDPPLGGGEGTPPPPDPPSPASPRACVALHRAFERLLAAVRQVLWRVRAVERGGRGGRGGRARALLRPRGGLAAALRRFPGVRWVELSRGATVTVPRPGRGKESALISARRAPTVQRRPHAIWYRARADRLRTSQSLFAHVYLHQIRPRCRWTDWRLTTELGS